MDWDSYRNIAGASTTTIKSSAGMLKRIIVNKLVAGSTITVYDSTTGSGTKMATISSPAILLNSQLNLEFGCGFNNGLTIVTSANDDVTVIYQ